MRTSAGLLLFRRASGLEVLLVHPGGPFWSRRDEGVWSVPKGECEPGEDLRATAFREFAEELGTAAPDGGGTDLDLGSVRQSSAKTVVCFAREADLDVSVIGSNTVEICWPPGPGGKAMTVPEVDRAQWCDLPTARRKLLAGQLPLLDRLEAALAPPG